MLHVSSPAAARFRTGVSLHSHTLHSRESLSFIYHTMAVVPFVEGAVRRGEIRYRKIHGAPLDLSRGWWTPPLGPFEAWSVEKRQIEQLGMKPLVSITDHDDIDAPVSLQTLDACLDVPISFEWTVPFGPTFFHLGIHNLPRSNARRWFNELADYTRSPRIGRLTDLLRSIHSLPGTLIVFNHPLWDESHKGEQVHAHAVRDFVQLHGECLHAFEINGLRPWRENRRVVDFAAAAGKPLISGGDRHALEPNANLNLTNASTFDEFASEVRRGHSEVLMLPHAWKRHSLRIVTNLIDVLRTHDDHANGWKRWSDRVFYSCEDGRVRALTELFGHETPAPIAFFIALVQFAARLRLRAIVGSASRQVLPWSESPLPQPKPHHNI
jgi:hypothetical protein